MKYIHHNITFLLAFTLLLFMSVACSGSDNSDLITEPDLYKLGEFTESGITVLAYSDQPLHTGYNTIYFEIHEDGVAINNAHVEYLPMMHMEQHSHASPFSNPGYARDGEHQLYKSWAVFTMPGGMMGAWELQITVQLSNHSASEISGVIEIDVENSNRVKTFITEGETRYVLTWVEPVSPQIGMNDLVVALHKSESMMSFPPVTNAVFHFEPWMPSMDHGSSNNVNPVHSENGFYEGQVHFNMTGDWELRFDIQINGLVIGQQIIELEF